MGKLFKFQAVAAAVACGLALSGCGNQDAFSGGNGSGAGNGGGTGVPGSGAQTGAASSIVVSYPITNTLTNLGHGFYRRTGSAIVTDEDGNIVPDGTQVFFKIIDSVKAEGTIDTADGDSLSSKTLTDTTPTLGDGTTATTMDMAYVVRNSGYRFIEPEDQVFLSGGYKGDLERAVSSTTLTASTVTVKDAYSTAYPNATYATGATSFVIGASHIGAEVAGVDADGVLTTGVGSTIDGIAKFAITYPANVDTVMVGCGSVPTIDTRYTPIGSADVYMAAYVSGNRAATITQPCFGYMLGGTLETFPSAMSSSGTVTVVFRDGGDTIPVSFAPIGFSVETTGTVAVTVADTDVAPATTNKTKYGGSITYNVTVAGGASGDTATITFDAGNGTSAEVAITVP